jgi:NADH:ubiquinone oxidoreductase subunit F (NADH-binding)
MIKIDYTTKSETSSPTVSLEMIIMSCTIDVKENRYVVVADIPGAFLHADMEGDVHMLLEGTIIIKLDTKLYRKYIWWIRNDKAMLYVRLKKALYGTLQAALLFWRLP